MLKKCKLSLNLKVNVYVIHKWADNVFLDEEETDRAYGAPRTAVLN